MKYLIPFVSMLMLTPAVAAPSLFENTAEPVLQHGLTDLAVCMSQNMAGVVKLGELYQSDPNEAELATANAKVLTDTAKDEGELASEVVNILTNKFHHPTSALEKELEGRINQTVQETKAKLNDVSTMEQFMKVFQPIIDDCNRRVKAFADQVKSTAQPLSQ